MRSNTLSDADTVEAKMQAIRDNPPAGYYRRDQLDDGAAEFYRENGFLVLLDGLTDSEITGLCEETVALCRGQRGEIRGSELQIKAGEDTSDLSDDEVIGGVLCIHFPDRLSPAMHDSLGHPALVDVLTRVIGPNVKCMQSMLFIKSAGKPGQAWHQDEDYIPTRDRSLAGAWISMDHATVDNGCLWVIPGSHKHGILWPQYPHDDPRFDCAQMSFGYPYDDDRDSISVEVPRGAVVFFNGYLLHRSLPNKTETGFRRALVNHYMSAESFLPWSHQEGVPMAQQDVRDIVMVAGQDPYEWKGTVHRRGGYIRAAGKGGCGDGRMSLEEYKATMTETA